MSYRKADAEGPNLLVLLSTDMKDSVLITEGKKKGYWWGRLKVEDEHDNSGLMNNNTTNDLAQVSNEPAAAALLPLYHVLTKL